jgi:hypothetical protein
LKSSDDVENHRCKVYKCDKCKKVFFRRFNLERHQQNGKNCNEKYSIQLFEDVEFLLYSVHTYRYPFPSQYLEHLTIILSELYCNLEKEKHFDITWHVLSILKEGDIEYIFRELHEVTDMTSIKEHLRTLLKNGTENLFEKKIENILKAIV